MAGGMATEASAGKPSRKQLGNIYGKPNLTPVGARCAWHKFAPLLGCELSGDPDAKGRLNYDRGGMIARCDENTIRCGANS